MDVVIDTVGSDATLAQAFGSSGRRPDRRVSGYSVDSTFGRAHGPLRARGGGAGRLPLRGLDELERAVRLVADGRVEAVIDRVLPLERANGP